MTVFSDKLSRLGQTIALVGVHNLAGLTGALAAGRGRLAIAIGSGGSTITAEYFARCRTTLDLGLTVVMTPMQFVMALEEWAGVDIWLFSAGANNPDIAGAFRCAAASRCEAIHLLTVRADGATAILAAREPRARVTLLPVADPKDGFLATHSMIAMVTALLIASDALTECPQRPAIATIFGERAAATLEAGSEGLCEGFRPGDTVIALHDPQAMPVASLIETSLWETGIAPVQRTDFRNFAHGRHVWAARHPDRMYVVALTSCETDMVWAPVAEAMPQIVRRQVLNLGNAGRLANAVGIIRALQIVSQLGDQTGIDPGRPGHGPFAEAIYDNPALDALAAELTPAVRHKAAARLFHDPVEDGGISLCVIGRARLTNLAQARFVGLALDYDGTVVPNHPTEARLGPPSQEVMDELVRLVDAGIQIGFATGRGRSAGEKLREALPERVHRQIIMGYYNGAHVRTLDIDIRTDKPEADVQVAKVAAWIADSGLLRPGVTLDVGRVQVTIGHADVADVAHFAAALGACPEVSNGRVRVLSSHHSFDVVPAGTSKLRLVDALIERAGEPDGAVLGIGDSGSPLGNDLELLSGPHGISVDSVCGSHNGAWTLFGSRLQGPGAVARILRAAQSEAERMAIDLRKFDLDAL
jgi:trehalose-6-phosphatase